MQSAMFLIMAQPKTNCIFRTFRVKESFWTNKQSCNLSKVDVKKWRPFFLILFVLTDAILLSLGLRKGANVSRNSGP